MSERIHIDVAATANTGQAQQSLQALNDQMKSLGFNAKTSQGDLAQMVRAAQGAAVGVPSAAPFAGGGRRRTVGERYTDVDGTPMIQTSRGPRLDPSARGGPSDEREEPMRTANGRRLPSLSQVIVGAATYQAYGHLMGLVGQGRGIAQEVGELSYRLGVPGVLPAGQDIDTFGKALGDTGAPFGYSRRETLRAASAYQKRLGLGVRELYGDTESMMRYARRYAEDLDEVGGFVGGVRAKGGIAEGKTQEFIRALGEGIERAQAQGRASDFREGFRVLAGSMTSRLPQLSEGQMYGALAVQTTLDQTGVRGWMGSTGAERWTRMFNAPADTPEQRAAMRYLYGFKSTSDDPIVSMVQAQQFAAGLPGNIEAQRHFLGLGVQNARGKLEQFQKQGNPVEHQYQYLAGILANYTHGRMSAPELVPLLEKLMPAKNGRIELSGLDNNLADQLAKATAKGPTTEQDSSYAQGMRRYQQRYERDREWLGRISGRTHSWMADRFGSTIPGDAFLGLLGIGGQWGATAAGAYATGAIGGGAQGAAAAPSAGGGGGSVLSTALGTALGMRFGGSALQLAGRGLTTFGPLGLAIGAGIAGGYGLHQLAFGDETFWNDVTFQTRKGFSDHRVAPPAKGGRLSEERAKDAAEKAKKEKQKNQSLLPWLHVPSAEERAQSQIVAQKSKEERERSRAANEKQYGKGSDGAFEGWRRKWNAAGSSLTYTNKAKSKGEAEYRKQLEAMGLSGERLEIEMSKYRFQRQGAEDLADQVGTAKRPTSARMGANVRDFDRFQQEEMERAKKKFGQGSGKGKLAIKVEIKGGTPADQQAVSAAVAKGVKEAASGILEDMAGESASGEPWGSDTV